jgi:polyribonucleotide nucleotidyltransferase
MKDAKFVEIPLGSKTLRIETGVLAQQAAGAVMVQIGDTVLFCAVSGSSKPREGIDFFPLQVEYREKFYSAGRFPGGYFKREARPSEKEVLTMRVTDRPIRPLFPKGYHNDVQINAMVMSVDGEHEPDMQCINAASAALTLSEIPFMGPIGAVRVGRVDGELVIEPTQEQILASDLNLVYVGTREKTMMIEGDADEVPEDEMITAMRLAHETIVPIVDAQLELRRMMGLPDKVVEVVPVDQEKLDKCFELAGEEMFGIMTIAGKTERSEKVEAMREKLGEQLAEVYGEDLAEEEYFHLFDEFEIQVVRKNVLEHGKRIDGRAMDEMRPLAGEVNVLPSRVHGSAVFARGETQAMATITLSSKKDAQSMDGVTGGPTEKDFLLHYNFPPYSVGEAGRLGMTSRREIGHGNLAERSLKPMMPDDYPYAVRIVSEVMSSNGSTSMASTCAASMALMDAGIPVKKPIAGISVGLFTGDGKSVPVLDILGTEDHCGDMDFKVCGTSEGITGFQVDMKIHGLDWEQVEVAFSMAHKGRMQILEFISTVISEPREDLSPFAPRVVQIQIDPEKIGAVIGPGGKIIRGLTEEHQVQIDIEEDGTVSIYSNNAENMAAAKAAVEGITAEAEPGRTYDGVVTGTKDFGAFVEIIPGLEGLVHISELDFGRVNSTEDVCKVGDKMKVKCLDVGDNGRVSLSRRAVLEDEGQTPPPGTERSDDDRGERSARPQGERRGGGGRGGDRRGGGRR